MEVILGYFDLTDFGVIEFSRIVFTEFVVLEFFGTVRIVWLGHIGARIEFYVLVESLLFCMGSARIWRAC